MAVGRVSEANGTDRSTKGPSVSAIRPEVSIDRPSVSIGPPFVETAGPFASIEGPLARTGGRSIEARGRSIDANGRCVDATGPFVSIGGPFVSANRRSIETKGRFIEAIGRWIEQAGPLASIEGPFASIARRFGRRERRSRGSATSVPRTSRDRALAVTYPCRFPERSADLWRRPPRQGPWQEVQVITSCTTAASDRQAARSGMTRDDVTSRDIGRRRRQLRRREGPMPTVSPLHYPA